MTAFLVFSENEPVIVATPRKEFASGRLPDLLERIGIDRFIAHEVELDQLRKTYGVPFEVIEADIKSGKALRVIDSNGHHVFSRIKLDDLGPAFTHGL
jgi:hypothetical protein